MVDVKGELCFSQKYTFKEIEQNLKENNKVALIEAFKRRISGFYLKPAEELLSGSAFNAFATGVLCVSTIDCLAFINENCKRNNTRKRFTKWVRENIDDFNKKYLLFIWDDISTNNESESKKLRNFLKYNYNLEWVESANIKKINNGGTIIVFSGSKSLLLELNKTDKTISVKFNKKKRKLFFREQNGKTEVCDYLANRFYAEFRNGLVHEGRIKNGGQFSCKYEDLVFMLKGAMLVNPKTLLKKINKPQINADERRFVHQVHLRLINLIKSQRAQRTQSIAAMWRNGTRIRRIFTDNFNPGASVSSVKSVFYLVDAVSAFICVHPRLIIFNQKSEI